MIYDYIISNIHLKQWAKHLCVGKHIFWRIFVTISMSVMPDWLAHLLGTSHGVYRFIKNILITALPDVSLEVGKTTLFGFE